MAGKSYSSDLGIKIIPTIGFSMHCGVDSKVEVVGLSCKNSSNPKGSIPMGDMLEL